MAAASQPVVFLLIAASSLLFGTAESICNTHNWDSRALHKYCTDAGAPTYRSPACSIYRLCGSASAAGPSLGPAFCSADRIFVTLCADRPDVLECTTFQQRFASAAAHSSCLRSAAHTLWSTDGVRGALAALCGRGGGDWCHSPCTASRCDTDDPLLAYAGACREDPTAAACGPWAEFCARETVAAAPALCSPQPLAAAASAAGVSGGGSGARVVLGAAAADTVQAPTLGPPLPPADPCILNSTQPSCKSYIYPDSAALANIDRLCGSMPDMPGCAIARACASSRHRVAEKYCRPFVLLATLCHDMPGMRGCENYKALCRGGSVVQQCADQGPVPSAPTWSQARKAVFAACGDHPMAGCANCSAAACPDPLASLADICHEMPDMAACSGFWAFCDAASRQDVAEWCADDDSKYLPSMLMYFHQRTQELLLWREWRPRTTGQYAASCAAIVVMGLVATGLKTAKGALVLQWSHTRALNGQVEPPVYSVWRPRSGQMGEILTKAAITGVSLTLDYFNMLIAMTFNVGFFAAVIAGYIAGTLLFSHVLENYAAILHQRRRELAAKARRQQQPHPQQHVGMMNGNGSARLANGGATAAGGLGGRMLASSDEDEEEKLLMVIEGEGQCDCVHSA